MASGEHGDQELFDRCILADDDLGYLLLDLGERLPEGFRSRHFFRGWGRWDGAHGDTSRKAGGFGSMQAGDAAYISEGTSVYPKSLRIAGISGRKSAFRTDQTGLNIQIEGIELTPADFFPSQRAHGGIVGAPLRFGDDQLDVSGLASYG